MINILVTINPSLPCATIRGAVRCGKPARAAWVNDAPTRTAPDEPPPILIIAPVCRDCAAAMAAAYEEKPQ